MPEIVVEVRQEGATTASEGSVRGHRVMVDRPEAKGGGDQGAMGGELLLIGLGGCFMSNLIAALKARDLQARDLGVTVRGSLEGTPPRYQSVRIEVTGTGLDADVFDKLITMSERACIAANTLRPALELAVVRSA